MQLEARITTLEFEPRGYIKVNGIVWSDFSENRICADGTNEFNLGWFWYSDLPLEVAKILKNVVAEISIDLQARGAIPKQWPGKLDDKPIDDGVFTFELKKIVIHNSEWNISKKHNYVEIEVDSKFHDYEDLISKVPFSLHERTNKILFDTLDKHL